MVCIYLFAFFFTPSPAQTNPDWEEFLLEEYGSQSSYGLSRATLFIERIKEIFRKENVPEYLAWIALIESSFRPFAESKSGAKGLFQFKAETAVHFGLRVSYGRDERTFAFLSAQAGARYLRYLYSKFGDWDLVLAAYNLGEGTLRRTMDRTGTKRWVQVKVYLRQETREYVPKVHAAARIGEKYVASGQSAKCLLIKIEKGDTLYRISKKFSCQLEELRRLNGLSGNALQVGQTLIVPQMGQ